MDDQRQWKCLISGSATRWQAGGVVLVVCDLLATPSTQVWSRMHVVFRLCRRCSVAAESRLTKVVWLLQWCLELGCHSRCHVQQALPCDRCACIVMGILISQMSPGILKVNPFLSQLLCVVGVCVCACFSIYFSSCNLSWTLIHFFVKIAFRSRAPCNFLFENSKTTIQRFRIIWKNGVCRLWCVVPTCKISTRKYHVFGA
jgi:hypothetical protein